MTTSINWPATLPTRPTVAGYGESHGVLVARTPMDKGAPKMRALGKRPDLLMLGFEMSTTQVATLETFVKTTIAGVKRFNFTHPRTSASVECRIVPVSEGEYYKVAYLGPLLWRIDLQMEVLPS